MLTYSIFSTHYIINLFHSFHFVKFIFFVEIKKHRERQVTGSNPSLLRQCIWCRSVDGRFRYQECCIRKSVTIRRKPLSGKASRLQVQIQAYLDNIVDVGQNRPVCFTTSGSTRGWTRDLQHRKQELYQCATLLKFDESAMYWKMAADMDSTTHLVVLTFLGMKWFAL